MNSQALSKKHRGPPQEPEFYGAGTAIYLSEETVRYQKRFFYPLLLAIVFAANAFRFAAWTALFFVVGIYSTLVEGLFSLFRVRDRKEKVTRRIDAIELGRAYLGILVFFILMAFGGLR